MSIFRISAREKSLARIAPITDKSGTDRRMRVAILRALRKGALAVQFGQQQAFDRALATLVQKIPISDEIAEWFRNEKLIPQKKKRSWKKVVRNPAVLSIGLALAVIAGVVIFIVLERMHEFPGSGTARKMLTIASSMRGVQLDPVEAEAGSLGDFFFMKYRLEHYDVPAEFADLRTEACRVFDDDGGQRIAQITVPERRMQFFLFPAARSPKDAKPLEFTGWRFVEHEGWWGAVQTRSGVCFMAVMRDGQRELATYLAKAGSAPAAAGSAR
ncbi:MAG: hypothetical protein ABI883_07355 [Chthoniobacterales bacterium]